MLPIRVGELIFACLFMRNVRTPSILVHKRTMIRKRNYGCTLSSVSFYHFTLICCYICSFPLSSIISK